MVRPLRSSNKGVAVLSTLRCVEGFEYVFVPKIDRLAPRAQRVVVQLQDFDEHFHDYFFQAL